MSGLVLENVTVERSGFPIVREISLSVAPGGVTLLLGPNGAGKTTLLEAISGVLPCQAGRIILDGRAIQKLPRVARARLGLAHVEQGRTVFAGLSVDENLRVAAQPAQIAQAYDLFPELVAKRRLAAGMLSGGEQQMLVLARALINQPQVVLIDELSLGLAPLIVRRLLPLIQRLAQAGMAILLVEQFASLALAIAEQAFILNHGTLVYQGHASELQRQPALLQQGYLGGSSSILP
jgi:branched-chain amino acid transport system ATP-binding protein